MPAVQQLFSEDGLLLSLESWSALGAAAVSKSVIGVADVVNAVHVDSVTGSAYAGAFFAGPLISGQRQLLALVTDSSGAVLKLTGTITDSNEGMGTGTISVTPQSGVWNNALPHYFGLVKSGSNVTGTVDGLAWSSAIAFTLELSGQILLRVTPGTDECEATLYTPRVFPGTSINMIPYYSVHPPSQPEITTGLGDPSLWSAPVHRHFVGAQDSITGYAETGGIGDLSYQDEKHTHAIIGAQFGDLEFDIGKSVPWVNFFTDDVFIADVNAGDPRYWVIDWDKTFPKAKVISLGVDYFTDPVGWRKAQFAAADAAWHYSDDDWVLFLDGSEGLSCDTRSQPDDVNINPFRSYLHREITRAEGLGKTTVSLPWFAFVRNADQPDPRRFYQIPTPNFPNLPMSELNTSVIHVATPYYAQMNSVGQRGLVRLVKVSTIRNPSFDWSSIDTPSIPDDDVKIQIISYAYARWTNPLVPPLPLPWWVAEAELVLDAEEYSVGGWPNIGTVPGTGVTTGVIGFEVDPVIGRKVLNLDGTSWVTMDNTAYQVGSGEDFTLIVVAKADTATLNSQIVGNRLSDVGNAYGYCIRTSSSAGNNSPVGEICTRASSEKNGIGPARTMGTWQTLALVRDQTDASNGTLRGYTDAVSGTASNYTGESNLTSVTPRAFKVGAWGNNIIPFVGQIAAVLFFRRVLTPAELVEIGGYYTDPPPLSPGDDGMKMRTKISQVRTMDGMPTNGDSDQPGVGGPYIVAVNGVLTPVPGEQPHTEPLRTPMYSSLFRVNPQDGVWYVKDGLAPEVTSPPWAYAFPPPHGFGRGLDATVSAT